MRPFGFLAAAAVAMPLSFAQAQSSPALTNARIEVTPRQRTITAGDSIQLHARLVDEGGRPIEGARYLFVSSSHTGEGRVDSNGVVVASAVGKLPITVTAVVPGMRPVIDSLELQAVPGPAARVAIVDAPKKLVVGQQLRAAALAYSTANDRAQEPIQWTSSAPSIVRASDGVITALAPGKATLTARAGGASASTSIQVVAANIARLSIELAGAHVRQGDVVRMTAVARDAKGATIAGLSPTWSFSPGDGQLDADGSFVAYRPGDYLVTALLGGKSASSVVHATERDVRRPVTVVARVPRIAFPTSEVWIHQNGKVAYLGTHSGGDRVYSIDISNPAKPVVVDSIQANTRLVNDMQTTPDGNYMVFTREGAADRKNGIVIADTHDPLHPKEVAQFTDGVAAGVHSVYIYKHPTYGQFVFITNDGTGAIDVVDITDPTKPKKVTEFRTKRPDAARYVHDIDIVDGLLYASYWNDGLVILDIGNGMKGGRPDHPVMVTQYKYNLDSLYRDVEAVSAPGFNRGTHTAWRQRGGKYVFIADEVYRNGNVRGAKDASADRMYGTLQVLDVSDIEHPKAVAWYTPENGGVHNVWVVGDTLYMGAYDAGFHVFDISGELRGDLRAQGREIASLNTADMDGNVKNSAQTWGVVVNPKDGLSYVNDFNNGLWIVRVDPKPPLVP